MTKISLIIKEKAIKLRKTGYSLKEIADKLKISKSTASLWMTNISLNTQAQERLKKRITFGQYKSKLAKLNHKNKLIKSFQKIAAQDFKNIPKNPSLYRLLCSLLFWCEGTKNNTTQIKFTNSDPNLIKYFLFLFRNGFQIDEGKFRAIIHLHNYHNEQKQITYWSKITKIPKKQFYKSYNKPNTGKRIKLDYQGCIAVNYYDARLAKTLWAYYKEAGKAI
jgi:hypothetical protein